MSAPSSPASADSISDSPELGFDTLGSVSAMLGGVESLPIGGRESPSTRTCDRSMHRLSTSSPADSHASPSVLPESDSLKPTNGGSGLHSQEPFADFDPDSSSWRTFQGSLLEEEGWETYSATWPDSGTSVNGTAYRRRPLVPRTFGIESGLLPTPTRQSYGFNQQESPGAAVRPSLETMARHDHWKTPTAAPWSHGGGGGELQKQVNWPTPTRKGNYNKKGLSAKSGDGLATRWPTPKASPSGPDYARANRPKSGGDDLVTSVARTDGGPLNPTWVEWLMGFPLGWTSLPDSETP